MTCEVCPELVADCRNDQNQQYEKLAFHSLDPKRIQTMHCAQIPVPFRINNFGSSMKPEIELLPPIPEYAS
jgi:hypothetical protein